MIVVAGPPGSGKSTAFPLAEFGVDFFNADDVAAALNGGSYIGISLEVRRSANREFETFVYRHIQKRKSFAIETTLRSGVTFPQALLARKKGFLLIMFYIAVSDVKTAINRVAIRADAGGHSAPLASLKRTYKRSLSNLSKAIRIFDHI